MINLAKSGYTTFPLLPLSPSIKSNPTDTPLSSLLLRWSSAQKRLRARNPGHPGAVVPIVFDPGWESGDGAGKFGHAGDTIRAYCRDNGLRLVGNVCATTTGYRIDNSFGSTHSQYIQQNTTVDTLNASPSKSNVYSSLSTTDYI